MRERAASYDPSLDATVGSPFDVKVIQPLIRREGIDPFSVDLTTFLVTRLKQAYPKMALDEGDNLIDLLIKANSLLWDPLVRETTRVKRNSSFQDPTTLTVDEADSLGANFFSPRRRGRFTRGPARILFGTPSNQSVTQNNFVTANGGLIYFPIELQSIRAEEMNLNTTEGNLYYFDINVIAERPGSSYDIGPNELASIANMPAAVRVTNTRRFKFGEDEEGVVDYVNRLAQSLGEKSMVTLRGIAAKLLEGFPEVNRLNVVGYNDPEMQRDIVTGGGVGSIIASGKAGTTVSDGENQGKSRRFMTDEVDFAPLMGRGGLVLSLVGDAIDGGDHNVLAFVETDGLGNSVIDLEDQVLPYGETGLRWFLRRREITLSHIPGGIVFPDSPNGTVSIPDGSVHIGGAHDIYLRTADFDEATFTIQNVTDDEPVLSGTEAEADAAGSTLIRLHDYKLDEDYVEGDAVYTAFTKAAFEGWSIRLQEGSSAGTYRILSVTPQSGSETLVVVDTEMTVGETDLRWQMFDEIDISLNEPKDTRVSGLDMATTQGSDVVFTGSVIDFRDFGVGKGDTLRLLSGEDAGDYTIFEDPLVPNGDRLKLEVELPRSSSDIQYAIFKANEGQMNAPLVRVRSVELLDSSSQPQGSFVPYANPVDVQSRSFQNPARGVKHDINDGRLGLLSQELSFPLDLTTANVLWMVFGATSVNVTLTAAVYNTIQDLVDELNTAILAATSAVYTNVAVQVGTNRFGIRPAGTGFILTDGGSALVTLFGGIESYSTADIRSDEVTADGGWVAITPLVDYATGLDVLQVIGGRNAGFHSGPYLTDPTNVNVLFVGTAVEIVGGQGTYFSPEINRDILIGTRSIGSARVYFLEPTTFEVDSNDSVFELDLGQSGIVKFIPDPTLTHQQIPPLPNGESPNDGSSAQLGSVFDTASQDFLLSGINPDDKLVIDFFPIYGDVINTPDPDGIQNPVVGLVGTTLIYSIDGGADHTLTFIRDDTSLDATDVSRDGVAAQVNAIVGLEIATIEETSTGVFNLVIRSDLEFVVRKEGTSNDLILGQRGNVGPSVVTPPVFSVEDQDNVSPYAGTYNIVTVGTTDVTIDETFPSTAAWPDPVEEQTYKVLRTGVQRINTTAMSENQVEADLYYFDVELISEGAGDFWNIESGQQMTVTGYKSDGYRLETDDENLTFSDAERVKMIVSRTILEQGVDDDPINSTQLSGQNLQVTYDRSSTIENVQDFAQSDVERVVCASPLARHLIPHFIRFDVIYSGGSKESVVVPDVERYIKDLFPTDTLDSSDLQGIITGRGATYVQNPIDLIAVVHRIDRSVYLQRSQDRLSTGRLSSFIPDLLNIVRSVGPV